MDVLKEISNSEERDILISLSRDRSWLEYLTYFMGLRANSQSFSVIVENVPKTSPGKRCFVIFDGFLRGWMEISKIRETEENDICIELNPTFITIGQKIPMADIQGYKYFFDNSNMQ
jgi:hypothetical protein